MATFSGQAGALQSQPGLLELGGPVAVASANPTLSASTLPYLAHIYTNAMAYKGAFGPLLNRPSLKYGLNSGYSPITIEVPVELQPTPAIRVAPGDIVKLTEQGGDGSILYTGIVEDVPDEYGSKVKHAIDLSHLVVELGDTPFSRAYTTATDPAQMVRDAIATTAHLSYTDTTIPASSVTGIYTFTHATVLDVLNVAKHIMGVNTYWHVGPEGQVWFQTVNFSGAAHYTVAQGVHFSARRYRSPIGNLKNSVFAVGGVQPGGSAPITATYTDASSQASYGVRAHNPPMVFPTVTDQGTLNAIVNSVGAMLHNRITMVELEIENYTKRITLTHPGGPLMRYFEPDIEPSQESGAGSGAYVGPYVIMDVEVDGPFQRVKLASVPTAQVTPEDLNFEIGRILARQSILSLDYTAAALNQIGTLSGGGLQTATSGARWVLNQNAFSASDGTNTRVEMGNLGVNGVSSAGWKFRANKSDGTPLFDSDGLIATLTQLVGVSATSTPGVTVTGTVATIDLYSQSFTLTRATNILLLGNVTGYEIATVVGPVVITSNIAMQVVGQTPSAVGGIIFVANGGIPTLTSCQPTIGITALAAGTYTAKLQWTSLSGVNDNLIYFGKSLYVYALGG